MNRPASARSPADNRLAAMLEDEYLDIDHWPHAWRVEPEDLARGNLLLEMFKVFLIDQLQRSRSRKVLRTHRDNLHILGGQMIRLWHNAPHLRKRGILRMLLEAIGDDGGPIVYPPLTAASQRAFDSTCRLLHRFTTPR